MIVVTVVDKLNSVSIGGIFGPFDDATKAEKWINCVKSDFGPEVEFETSTLIAPRFPRRFWNGPAALENTKEKI